MSVKAIDAVWTHSEASGNALLLLLAIADNANDDGYAWPSHKHLGAKTRQSDRNVRRILTQLLDTDELSVVRNGAWGDPNVYAVKIAALRAKPSRIGRADDPNKDVGTPQADNRCPPDQADISGGRQMSAEPSEGTVSKEKDLAADAAGQLFESEEVKPPAEPDPLDAAVRIIWDRYVLTFQPQRTELTDSNARMIRKGFKEIMAGRTEPTDEDVAYLQKAISGLQIWRKQKPGDTRLGTLFKTWPGSDAIGDRIAFYVDQAESGGTSASPKVPSVLSGTISARKREVLDMLAYPDSPDHKERGLAAMEWLKNEAATEPIIGASGQLQGWRTPS